VVPTPDSALAMVFPQMGYPKKSWDRGILRPLPGLLQVRKDGVYLPGERPKGIEGPAEEA
jgi:hypothetical protein